MQAVYLLKSSKQPSIQQLITSRVCFWAFSSLILARNALNCSYDSRLLIMEICKSVCKEPHHYCSKLVNIYWNRNNGTHLAWRKNSFPSIRGVRPTQFFFLTTKDDRLMRQLNETIYKMWLKHELIGRMSFIYYGLDYQDIKLNILLAVWGW